jgi:hypothetical protein
MNTRAENIAYQHMCVPPSVMILSGHPFDQEMCVKGEHPKSRYDIYFLYHSDDNEIAGRLLMELQTQGFSVFVIVI